MSMSNEKPGGLWPKLNGVSVKVASVIDIKENEVYAPSFCQLILRVIGVISNRIFDMIDF